MAATARTLSAEVTALTKDFQRTPAGLMMEKKTLAGWHRTLKALPTERHAHLADELLALSAKFRRLGGPATAQARAQLSAVAALLILSAGKSRADSSFTDAPHSPPPQEALKELPHARLQLTPGRCPHRAAGSRRGRA